VPIQKLPNLILGRGNFILYLRKGSANLPIFSVFLIRNMATDIIIILKNQSQTPGITSIGLNPIDFRLGNRVGRRHKAFYPVAS
jgi:hypothetical protein